MSQKQTPSLGQDAKELADLGYSEQGLPLERQVLRERGASRINVFLVDTHPVLREGLRALLSATNDLRVIGEASDPQVALTGINAMQPDLVVAEALEEMPLAHFFGRMQVGSPRSRVLIFSAQGSRASFQQAFAWGATGYLLKRSPLAEVITALRAVAAGGVYVDTTIARSIMGPPGRRSLGNADALHRGGPSEREMEVIRLSVLGHSNKEIASLLGTSVKTVQNQKSRGTRKLGFRARSEVVQYVMNETTPRNASPADSPASDD